MQGPKTPARSKRIAVHYEGVVTTANGAEQTVIVTDISADGFRFKGQVGLTPGEHVYLRVGKHGNVAAEIRWVDDSEAGGVLLDKPTV